MSDSTIRSALEVACDGYETLAVADVPDDVDDPASSIAGATTAARMIALPTLEGGRRP